jgi:hypothetical protein
MYARARRLEAYQICTAPADDLVVAPAQDTTLNTEAAATKSRPAADHGPHPKGFEYSFEWWSSHRAYVKKSMLCVWKDDTEIRVIGQVGVRWSGVSTDFIVEIIYDQEGTQTGDSSNISETVGVTKSSVRSSFEY